MLLPLEHRFHAFNTKTCDNSTTIIIIVLGLFLLLSFCALNIDEKINIVYVDADKPTRTVNKNFISFALDTVAIANNLSQFDPTNPILKTLLKALSPAYFRIGGTLADRLIFAPNSTDTANVYYDIDSLDAEVCLPEDEIQCNEYYVLPNFTMSATNWLALNNLAKEASLDLIFDLNVLLRFDNGSWDYRNAENLITFTQNHGFSINYELGNEPNLFKHQFDYILEPKQLSQDFKTLKNILNRINFKGLLIGPDVTRPRIDNKASQVFLAEFLDDGPPIDRVTFHQYYFDGRTAKAADFLDPIIFDILKWQIVTAKSIVVHSQIMKPIWLGETSSAYGGGAPGLSNRFIASFIWLDKLGIAAKYGIDVVIRQTIFGGNYALINQNFEPSPDFWVSVLYKHLVSERVIDCFLPSPDKVRFYCHCSKEAKKVVVFGMNLNKQHTRVRVEGQRTLYNLENEDVNVDAYILTTTYLESNMIFLNGNLLKLTKDNKIPEFEPVITPAYPYLNIPPQSMAFWVMSTDNPFLC